MTPRRTVARGYGARHQRERARVAKAVARGEAFCAAPRCKHPRGRWIAPGERWDLGHHPYDRSVYLGPLHEACNRDTTLERSRQRPRMTRAPAQTWL